MSCSSNEDKAERIKYLTWVWEVSHLPFLFVNLGECRDAYKLKLARSWKRNLEAWCRLQVFLEKRGNPHAWQDEGSLHPTRAWFLGKYGGTEDDIEDGIDLMNEIGYYGISDEWKIDR